MFKSSLGGITLSKVKKIVSVMLAAAMLLSFVPTAFADYVYTAEGADTFHYDGTSTVTNVAEITFDSSETTETVRIADTTNSLLNGNYIVAANSAGIPETSGNFLNFAYGVEAPFNPKVIFKIRGISDTSLVSGISITNSSITGYSQQTVSSSTGTENGTPYIRYEMPLKTDKSWSVSGPGSIVFTITFTYAGKEYVGHAYMTAKYVVRPNGVLRVGQYRASSSRNKTFAHVSQLLCAQSVPGFASTSGGSHSYFQYDTQVTSGNAISGGGNDDTGNGTVIVNNYNYGGIVAINTDYSSGNYDDWPWIGSNPNNNQIKYAQSSVNGMVPRTTVYIDKSYDHLGTGTLSGKTNGLNMRMVWKTTDQGSSHPQRVCFTEDVAVRANANAGSNISASVASVGSGTLGTFTADLTHVYHDGSGYNNLNAMRNQGRQSNGNGGYVNANGDTIGGNFVMHKFGGTGALTSGTTWSIDYMIKSTKNDTLNDDGWLKVTSTIQVNFVTYDTATLRSIISAIDNGTGFTYNGTTYTGKGKFPQSWMYSGGWANFETAYNNAMSTIANFQVTQSNVNTAVTNLVSAYNGLTGYVPSGSFYVKHCLFNTTDEIVPMQTFSHAGTWANPSSDAIKNGASVKLYALSDIAGYNVVGASSFTGSVSFNSDGAILTDSNNATHGNTITFYYQPAEKFLKVHTGIYGIDATTGTSREYVMSESVVAGTQLNSLNSSPNFTTIKANLLANYEQPAHTTYAGMFTNASYSGSPIDGINVAGGAGDWEMPFTDTDVYVKWVASPVKLKIVTSAGTVDTSSPAVTPSMTGAPDYQLGSVTFNEPANSPTVSGYLFAGYYKDSAYTQPITSWPIEADYEGNYDYVAEDGTGSEAGFGYVTIYAKYEDVNNKIVFVPGANASIANGTTNGGFTVTDNVLDFSEQIQGQTSVNIDFPTPVREGYAFKGWTLSDGTPVLGWTTGNASQGYNPVYIDADNLYGGTHPQTGSTGFIAYAQWEALPVTITFLHNIPSAETSKINSKNMAGTNYYYQIGVPAESAVVQGGVSTLPPEPRRYGYVFDFWTLNGVMFDPAGNYPAQDATLIARWSNANSTVFGDLTSYVSLSGSEVETDLQHAPETATTPIAMKGDTVRIKFNAAGKFYAGSSSWIFAYDNDFFEEVSGVTVARVNPNNAYISGIGSPTAEVVESSLVEAAYSSQMGTVVDPYSGETITNPGYAQVLIDPNLQNMSSYTTQSFDDINNWVIELTLKIKPNTTKTQGSVWLPEQLIRTGDNIMGDTFIAYSASARSLQQVKTDEVNYDVLPVTTVNILEQTRPVTSITAALPTQDGAALGTFSDGTTANKTFIGPAETEIYNTYTADNVTYYETYTGSGTPTQVAGFPEPTRTGYHLTGWVNANDATDTWSTDTEAGAPREVYNFASDEQDGNTYVAQWAPDEFTLYFYTDSSMTTQVWGGDGEVTVYYDQLGSDIETPDLISDDNITFLGWIHEGDEATEENLVDFSTYVVRGDDSFYAYTRTTPKTVTLVAQFYAPSEAQTDTTLGTFELTTAVQALLGLDLRAGDVLKIVNEIPATPETGVQYILASDVAAIFKATNGDTVTFANGNTYTMAGTPISNVNNRRIYALNTDVLPTSFTVLAANASNRMNVPYTNGPVEVIFQVRRNNQTFDVDIAEGSGYVVNADGSITKTITGPYMGTYDMVADSAGASRFGYSITAWSGVQPGVFNSYSKTHNATWTAANVTFHFMADDHITEVATATGTYTANQALTATPAPTKDGYNLTGWLAAKKAEGATTYEAVSDTVYALGSNYNCSNNPQTNIVQTIGETGTTYDIYFIPVFTAQPYPVVYYTMYADGNGATTQYGQQVDVPYGDTYTPNTTEGVPAVTGYTFHGWYNEGDWSLIPDPKDSNTAQPFTMGNTTKELYGFYVPNTYDVKFYRNYDENDDTIHATVSTNFNAPIVAPETAPTRTGYDFLGWAKSRDGSPINGSLGNLTTEGDSYYAIWTPSERDYFVDYYIEDVDGTYVKADDFTVTRTGTVGATVSVTAEDKAQHIETGFVYDANASALTETGTIPAEGDLHLAIYISRVASTYKSVVDGVETYLNADGTACADQSESGRAMIKYGTAISAPADPTKEGFTFAGWTPAVGETMPAADHVITATWNVNAYDLTVALDGGSFAQGATNPAGEYNFGAELPTMPAPEKTGYEFSGWVFTKTEGGEEISAPATMPAYDVTATATWTVKQYTITLRYVDDNNNEVIINTITQNYGTDIATQPDPTRTGYTFAGWSETIPATMPAENKIITAQWTVNPYTITFNTDGGSEIAAITQDYGTFVAEPAAPTKEGYTFAGWQPAVPQTMPAENITVTAQWTVNEYTINFNSDGGSEVAAITANYGEAITAPADPTKEGYTFGGWFTDSTFATAYTIPATMPAIGANNHDSITLIAKWNVNEYTITFNTDGGTEIAPITKNFGENIVKPADPTKTGYTFAGWDTAIPDTMPAENLTITAQWTVNQYTITFNSNGGTPVSAITADYGSALTAPADPTREGYTFGGWSPAFPSTMPADNITLTAQWGVDQYTITFNTDGGSEIADITQDYGTAVTLPAAPTKTGYTFQGWVFTKTSDGSAAATPATMPAYNVTATAQWSENTYDVRFVQPDDTYTGQPTFAQNVPYEDFPNAVSVSYTQTLSSTPASGPAATYFEFKGWTTDPNAELDAAVIDLTVWTPEAWVAQGNDGTEIYFYPVYVRVEVTLVVETSSDADIVIPENVAPPVTGYVYNAGEKLMKNALLAQFEVTGNGHLNIIPSKGSQICGTGTRIELIDDYDGSIKEVYYLIVPGDVNGDSVCSANDLSIAEHARSQAVPTWYLKDKDTDTEEQLAEKARIRECYRLAADISDQYGVFDDNDTAQLSLYVLGGAEFSYDATAKKYSAGLI